MWNIGSKRQSRVNNLLEEVAELKAEKAVRAKILKSYRSKFASFKTQAKPFYKEKPLTKDWTFINEDEPGLGRHKLYYNSETLTVAEFNVAEEFEMDYHNHGEQGVKEESIILKHGKMKLTTPDDVITILPGQWVTIKGDGQHKLVAMEKSSGFVSWTPGLSEI